MRDVGRTCEKLVKAVREERMTRLREASLQRKHFLFSFNKLKFYGFIFLLSFFLLSYFFGFFSFFSLWSNPWSDLWSDLWSGPWSGLWSGLVQSRFCRVANATFILWRLTLSIWSSIWPLGFLDFFFRLLMNGVNVNINPQRILLIFACEAVKTALHIICFLITCKHFWETHSEIYICRWIHSGLKQYLFLKLNFLKFTDFTVWKCKLWPFWIQE